MIANAARRLTFGETLAARAASAGVAFRLAVQHPASVRRLALVSAGFAQDGFYPEMLPLQAQDPGSFWAPSAVQDSGLTNRAIVRIRTRRPGS